MPTTHYNMGALDIAYDMRITCPECSTSRDVAELLDKPRKSEYATCTCKGCGLRLGVSQNTDGDAICFDLEAALTQAKAVLKVRPTCRRGHPFTPDNVYLYQGKRRCKACIKLNKEKNKAVPRPA